jgi:chorismate mutase
MTRDDVSLVDLRGRLDDIDGRLLALIAERQRLGGEIARVKRQTGYPTRSWVCRPGSQRICCVF